MRLVLAGLPMRSVCWIVAAGMVLAGPALAGDAALRAGVLENAAPYVVKDAAGNLSGFTVELFRQIAARMHRPIEFTAAPQAALEAGLANGRFDVLPGPLEAVPERAAAMLLLEGYDSSEYQFATKTGGTLAALGDLRGKRLSVRTGSQYAEWAARNARRYGFTVIAYGSSADAAQAVLEGRADASLSGSPFQVYAAKQNPNYRPALSLPETRVHESAAVGLHEAELRDEMEDALRCLKIDGTVARLSMRWFGREPDAEDLEWLVVPGYGVPGLAGYDPKPRKTHC